MKVLLKIWIVFNLFSCNYDRKKIIAPVTSKVTKCDSIEVTYTKNIYPIINLHCSDCHQIINPTSGIPLGTYSQIAKYAKNGMLVGVITKLPGFQPMPSNDDTLTICEIGNIKQWVNKNYPND